VDVGVDVDLYVEGTCAPTRTRWVGELDFLCRVADDDDDDNDDDDGGEIKAIFVCMLGLTGAALAAKIIVRDVSSTADDVVLFMHLMMVFQFSFCVICCVVVCFFCCCLFVQSISL